MTGRSGNEACQLPVRETVKDVTKDTIFKETAKRFSQHLHSSFPLRHYMEYYDEADILKKAEELIENKKVKSEAFIKMLEINLTYLQVSQLTADIDASLRKHLEDWISQNAENKAQCKSMMNDLSKLLCKQFRGLVQKERALKPKISLEAFEDVIEERKKKAIDFFEDQWKNEMEQKEVLVKKLNEIGEDLCGWFKNPTATLLSIMNGSPSNQGHGQRESEVTSNADEASSPKRPRVIQAPPLEASLSSQSTTIHCLISPSTQATPASSPEAPQTRMATRQTPRTSESQEIYGVLVSRDPHTTRKWTAPQIPPSGISSFALTPSFPTRHLIPRQHHQCPPLDISHAQTTNFPRPTSRPTLIPKPCPPNKLPRQNN